MPQNEASKIIDTMERKPFMDVKKLLFAVTLWYADDFRELEQGHVYNIANVRTRYYNNNIYGSIQNIENVIKMEPNEAAEQPLNTDPTPQLTNRTGRRHTNNSANCTKPNCQV